MFLAKIFTSLGTLFGMITYQPKYFIEFFFLAIEEYEKQVCIQNCCANTHRNTPQVMYTSILK